MISTSFSASRFQGPNLAAIMWVVDLQDKDIEATLERFDNVGQLEYPAQDLSAEDWLRNGGANERMIDIAEACYANDFGCSLSQMGLRESILENRKWDSGKSSMDVLMYLSFKS